MRGGGRGGGVTNRPSAGVARAQVATHPGQDTVRNVKVTRGGQKRVKMISIDQDQEFQVRRRANAIDRVLSCRDTSTSVVF
jgi:aminoglycoside phosphotransferase (APT) family kinase protein